jgi:hypothetical protein
MYLEGNMTHHKFSATSLEKCDSITFEDNSSVVSDATLLSHLHAYPNLILWIARRDLTGQCRRRNFNHGSAYPE